MVAYMGGRRTCTSQPHATHFWNVGPVAVASVVRAITTVLADEGLPYTLKCPAEPALFSRRDSLVLYLARDVWRTTKKSLRRAHEGIATDLRDSTPPLTMRLGRGVALAEDPGNGRSFGETMAWAVADGVLAIRAARLVDSDEMLALMAARLNSHGIGAAQPYLTAGSLPGDVDPW